MPGTLGRGLQRLSRSLSSLLALAGVGQASATWQLQHLFSVLGYPLALSYEDFAALYARGGLAAAIVAFFPGRTWTPPPRVSDLPDGGEQSPFEAAWQALVASHRVYARFQRADILCSLGRYSVLALGFRGQGDPERPLAAGEGRAGLINLQAYPESQARIIEIETDLSSERFGKPRLYEIDPWRGIRREPGDASLPLQRIRVHASRIVHLSQEGLLGETYGRPVLESSYNRLLDIEWILGAGALAFRNGARPRISLQTREGYEMDEEDVEKLKEKIQAFQDNLQTYLWLDGVDTTAMPASAVDPRSHLEAQIQIVASAVRIPVRQLVGSEQAQLASVQDQRAVAATVSERQETIATPWLRDLLDKLQFAGALPSPQAPVQILWNSTDNLPEDVRAEIAKKKAEAIKAYLESQGELLVSPSEMRQALGLSPAFPEEVLDARALPQEEPSA